MIETTISETRIETIVVSEDVEPSIIIINDDTPNVIIDESEPGPQGLPGLSAINMADDTDVTDLQNGSVLVYSTGTEKWVATKLLDQQAIESGHY